MRGSDRQQGTDCRLEAESVSSELTRSFINLFFNSSVQSLCQPYLNHSRHLEIYYQCGQPMHSLYIQGESVTPDIVTINTDFLSAMCHPSTLRRGPRVFTLTESNYRQQIHLLWKATNTAIKLSNMETLLSLLPTYFSLIDWSTRFILIFHYSNKLIVDLLNAELSFVNKRARVERK